MCKPHSASHVGLCTDTHRNLLHRITWLEHYVFSIEAHFYVKGHFNLHVPDCVKPSSIPLKLGKLCFFWCYHNPWNDTVKLTLEGFKIIIASFWIKKELLCTSFKSDFQRSFYVNFNAIWLSKKLLRSILIILIFKIAQTSNVIQHPTVASFWRPFSPSTLCLQFYLQF